MNENENLKTETLTEIGVLTATQWYYERISELKKQLPTNHKMPLLALLPKEYDSYKGGLIINNVLMLRTTDMAVLKAIESLIDAENNKKGF